MLHLSFVKKLTIKYYTINEMMQQVETSVLYYLILSDRRYSFCSGEILLLSIAF